MAIDNFVTEINTFPNIKRSDLGSYVETYKEKELLSFLKKKHTALSISLTKHRARIGRSAQKTFLDIESDLISTTKEKLTFTQTFEVHNFDQNKYKVGPEWFYRSNKLF